MKVNKLIKTLLICLFLITPLSINASTISRFSPIPKTYESNNEVINYVQSLISLYKSKMYYSLQDEFVIGLNSNNYLLDYYEKHSDIVLAIINKTNNFNYTIDDIETNENITTVHLTITNYDLLEVNKEIGIVETIKKFVVDHEVVDQPEIVQAINNISTIKEIKNVEIRIIQTDEGYKLLAVPIKARAALLGLDLPF